MRHLLAVGTPDRAGEPVEEGHKGQGLIAGPDVGDVTDRLPRLDLGFFRLDWGALEKTWK
jgi:hypothetical protein